MLADRRLTAALFAWIAGQAALAAVFQAFDAGSGGLASLPSHASRLFGLAALLAVSLTAAVIAILSSRRSKPLPSTFFAWSAGFFLLLPPLFLAVFEALVRAERFAAYAAYPQALALPVLIFTLTGAEMALFWVIRSSQASAAWRSARWIFALLALSCAAVLVTRVGVKDLDNLFYGHPGIPLLEWQIFLALAAGAGYELLSKNLTQTHSRGLITWTLLALWIGTAGLWLSQPLVHGGYALAPQPPAYETYPFSDAMNYDAYAQTLLTGAGFNGQIPPRPLYVTFLAGLHALAGDRYDAVVAAQTLLLALFPALLFLLGARLASPGAGLALAVLAALRDLNTNLAAPYATNISYSKLLLSELPTALILVLFTLALLCWSRRGMRPGWEPLAAGALAGLAALLRTQSLIVLPAAFLLLLLPALGRKHGVFAWLRGLGLAVLAALFVIAPWIGRNYQLTGGLVFDDPRTQTMVLAQRYGNVYFSQPIRQEPGETTADYTKRLMTFALDNFRREPLRILSAAAAHWVNNLTGSLRVLPFRAEIHALSDFTAPTWAFWETRLEDFGPGLALCLGLAAAVFSFGLFAAFSHSGWAGLLPLAVNFAYNLWSALFLTSGERFLLPVDWAFLLYLCLGAFALLGRLQRIPEPTATPLPTQPRRPKPWTAALLFAACLLAGASIPLAEWLIPPRYTPMDQAEVFASLREQGFTAPLPPGAAVLQGRMLYPLYFPAGGGIPWVEDAGYTPSPQARLVFRLVGPQSRLVVLPLAAAPDLPVSGLDVWIVGQDQGALFIAAALQVKQAGEVMLWTASP